MMELIDNRDYNSEDEQANLNAHYDEEVKKTEQEDDDMDDDSDKEIEKVVNDAWHEEQKIVEGWGTHL